MTDKPKKTMPKGGRKGGTTFPRIDLGKALEYASKLVSKTHTGPVAESIILAGVFGNSGSDGQIRKSALKQYGLLDVAKNGIQASELARTVEAATPDERPAQVRRAFLKTNVFVTLYQTFQPDTVSRAKVRQQGLALKVHPDVVDDFVNIFVASLVTAALGKETPEGIEFYAQDATVPADTGASAEQAGNEPDDETDEGGAAVPVEPSKQEAAADPQDRAASVPPSPDPTGVQNGPRALFHVNVTLDSSLDIEKLEKQLQLLRRYGAV